jgi:ribonuclease R
MTLASGDQPGRPRIAVVVGDGTIQGLRPVDEPGSPVETLAGGPSVRDGEIVVVQPVATGWKVLKRLAEPGSLRAELVCAAVTAGADPVYPVGVMVEAAARAAEPSLDTPDLVDLRDLPWVTIDNRDSRDLDQALLVEERATGWRVRYALADASHFVQPGTALFAEALARGTSYYLPGFSIPMLPRVLSEGAISLNPGLDRRAMVFDVDLDHDGQVRSTRISRALVHSQAKLSYPQVQRAWDDPAGASLTRKPWGRSLEGLREVGRLRMADARRRHAVSFHRRESEIVLESGEPTGFRILTRERLEVERCNEQISLLVNIEGARFLRAAHGDDRVQPIFRVHPAPTPEALARFAAQTEALARLHGVDSGQWTWFRNQGVPLADYLDRLPHYPGRDRLAQAIERQALLTNERSSYGPDAAPHFGVAAPVYARFSSPMREIVGIFTHKEAFEALDLVPATYAEADVALRDQVVDSGNRARELQRRLEREAGRLVLDRLFTPELARPIESRQVMVGILLGLRPNRLYVLLEEPPVEVKVDVDDLREVLGDGLEVDPLGVEVAAIGGEGFRLRLGDRIRLRVARREAGSGRWVLIPVATGSSSASTPTPGSSASGRP